jgi:outer membrane protein
MNWKSLVRYAAVPALAATLSAPVFAQVLDVRGAIVATAEGKQAQAELQSQFAPRQAELENIKKQIDDIQKRLDAGQRTLSDDEKARLGRQGELLGRRGQRLQDELREELQAAEGEVIDRIGRKMREVLDRYARENGFTIIFDVSAQAGIVYATNTIDITQDIVRLYDQAHPIRGAAPAAAPPRPQTQPGTPAQKPPAQKPPQQ